MRETAGLDRMPQKYRRQGNSMTYCSDTATLYITRIKKRD